MSTSPPPGRRERLDVVIVGAGLSGIGVACHLRRRHPGRSFALFEARGATGGTWDLFRYPGIRSDSDLQTFGYAFRPWTGVKSIASGGAILRYLRDTASEHDLDRRVRLHHRVLGACWSTRDACWVVDVERTDTGERFEVECAWLFSASGYYRYDEGHTPRFEGTERFRGRIVHPQRWPEGLRYAGQQVVIIGSGATAVTLVPAMAEEAAHVTMVQRTPTYVVPVPSEDPVARLLGRVLPAPVAHALTRRKNIARQRVMFRLSRRYPERMRRFIRWANVKQLPRGYPVDEHFRPPYAPWDQRLCVAADGDLFRAIASGRASVVTDRVAHFTERGLRLGSGRELAADLVVTATGLELLAFGGMRLSVDGQPLALHERVAFKGMMLDGVPNFAFAIGYTNASWTLKVDLVAAHLCDLLAHMDARGHRVCRAVRPNPSAPTGPLLEFAAGYVRRAVDVLPRQGTEPPWVTSMDYRLDRKLLARRAVADPHLRFT